MELVKVSDEGYWHPYELNICRFLLFWDMVKDFGSSFLEFGPVGDIPLQSVGQVLILTLMTYSW